MQTKIEILDKIIKSGLVAIVRTDSPEKALKIAQACYKGGVAAIEISFTTPGAAAVIQELSAAFQSEELIIGAGTVLDPETARIAILAGAQYIISPSLNTDTIRLCNRYQVATMPGAMTMKEIIAAMEAGADIIKIFPGDMVGPNFIKAIKGPLPQALLMPTGGVSLENVSEWIKNGAVAVGVGGQMTAGAKHEDYAAITNVAKQFVAKIKEARGL